jgi:hypothetical protein
MTVLAKSEENEEDTADSEGNQAQTQLGAEE